MFCFNEYIKETGKKYIYLTVLTASLQFLAHEVIIATQFMQTINRLLIDCWRRLIDYELSPLGQALLFYDCTVYNKHATIIS